MFRDHSFPSLHTSTTQVLLNSRKLLTEIHAYQHICTTGRASISSAPVYASFESEFEQSILDYSLSLAIAFRRCDDSKADRSGWTSHLEKWEKQQNFWQLKPTKLPLGLRDVANKIIHRDAERFLQTTYQSFDQYGNVLFSCRASSAEVELSGRRNGSPWVCQVDLMTFSDSVSSAVFEWTFGIQ